MAIEVMFTELVDNYRKPEVGVDHYKKMKNKFVSNTKLESYNFEFSFKIFK